MKILSKTELKSTPVDPQDLIRKSDLSFSSGGGVPSDTFVALALPANRGSVTSPGDGYILLYDSANAGYSGLEFNNGNDGYANGTSAHNLAGYERRYMIPVRKDLLITVSHTSGPYTRLAFVPFK